MIPSRDLSTAPPRRWSDALGGIAWLPRLIDKTAAALDGTLGTYLYGQSPIDRGLLRALGLSHRDFAAVVDGARDDAAVLEALGARESASLERARAWSAALPAKYGAFLWLLDVDDGYRTSPLRGAIAVCADAVARSAKRLWPSRAAERAGPERVP